MKEYLLNNMKLHSISKEELLEEIGNWAKKNESRVICFANVHMNIECVESERVKEAVNSADIVCPDGMPLVWWLKRKGEYNQERLDGPSMMLDICKYAQENNLKIGLYGSEKDVLSALIDNLKKMFNDLKISYSYSPPFRDLTPEEEERIIEEINQSGVQILFVGLGCPKQEIWMSKNKGKINAVMLGVGAAFNMHAGKIKRAPLWMQRMGLEWLYRLMKEPRRLWRRYLYTNFKFIKLLAAKK
ncbi:WecB/TagA/CpsF family glycosyltransferase [Anaerocellum danielii]|uniref:WecB/TagA/CpsF family glycosyltransferase n=1 Tax=Anaerocellum danielii TaxID=1387557 RepID=A0ABZ0U236_9FIRM|nr:WecB/TagA/CpsF family glycosyltransferase [Caldicellulosiruptor danielii]WPX08504.1 WecB/TagA/CpsF family glycosyltransferase [Caldicellulosiruptor danielii]